MMMVKMNAGERALIGAGLYVLSLFCSLALLGWIVLLGGNPFISIDPAQVMNKSGAPLDKFRAGEVVGVKRRLCADSSTIVTYFPSLKDAQGVLFPLPSGVFSFPAGCAEYKTGFVVPPIPFGEYSYTSVFRFQKNLVGRDEHIVLSDTRFRIMRKRPAGSASEPGSEE